MKDTSVGGPERLDRQVAGQPDRRAEPRSPPRPAPGRGRSRPTIDSPSTTATRWRGTHEIGRPSKSMNTSTVNSGASTNAWMSASSPRASIVLSGGRERRRVVDAGRAATALAQPRLDERRVADAGRIVVDGRGGETGRSDRVDEAALVAARVDRIGSRDQDERAGRLEARRRAGEDRQLFVAGRDDEADPIVIADPQEGVDERRIVRAWDQPSPHRPRRAPRRADRYRPR